MKGELLRAYRIAEKYEGQLREHYEAQYLFASLAAMLSKYDIALLAALRAYEQNPDSYDAALLLGKIYLALRERDKACEFFAFAHAIAPQEKEAAVYYAVELYNASKPSEAETVVRELYGVLGDDPDVNSILAMIWSGAGLNSEARALIERCNCNEIENIDFLSRYFEVLISAQDVNAAIKVAERMIAILSRNGGRAGQLASAWGDLGAAYVAANNSVAAMEAFRKALDIDPSSKQALVNKAALHKSLEQYVDSVACYKVAAAHYPNDPQLCHHLNLLLREMGFLEESIKYGEMAVAMRPDSVNYLTNLGCSYFATGRLDRAWTYYEYRMNEVAATYRGLGLPFWQGDALNGRRLLVVREQGIGDEMLFSPLLRDLPVETEQIGFAVQPKLLNLMQRTFPALKVFCADTASHEWLRTNFDCVISLASLGGLYRRNVSDFYGKIVALELDPARVEAFTDRFSLLPSGLKIGFSWRSGLRGLRRDVHYPDDFNLWQPLFDLPGIQWVNAQYGVTEGEITELQQRLGSRFHPFADVDHYADLDSSCALLRSCDLVIAPCNSIAVQAGMVGRPVLRMAYGTDYFMLGTDHYPWLPTVQPMVRAYDEPWEGVFSRLRSILSGLLG
ncbi:tetratricopeptide repeat protein [Chitinilyticum piscinae]|uniref:Tetratricopeptide repeat protein n=1 Tax=Chitinilyticum piscinae TaxID=2866724 RepID=A0A8J7FJ70_9NEIS|nr:tetratricopeptide repeat protein [Chitinilyticum piscinae]MBE9608822.1 tetratricopeptide repeat protein [Chitinilyticum piscinae]